MRIAHLSAAALALLFGAIGLANALEPAAPPNIAEIRLLPPSVQPLTGPPPSSMQVNALRAVRAVRERHPEVFDRPLVNGRYLVTVLLNADGNAERTELRQAEGAGLFPGPLQQLRPSPDVSVSSNIYVRKGEPLPDGTLSASDLVLQVNTLPQHYDASRSVSRVHEIVRERYANLLLPANGEVLNRLTIFLDARGQVERENVELIRFDSLRRAPLEDEKFAERMAERFANTLGIADRKIGVVGFTYVEDGTVRLDVQPNGRTARMDERRTLLVQYAWPRWAGELGPTMPMAAKVQQQPQTFDTAAALALAEYHFRDAFHSRESAAGTPTIVLNPQGEVLRTGRVQYRSGEIHETSLQQQLMPGVTLQRLISPTLKNSAGGSAVVTFAWVTGPTR